MIARRALASGAVLTLATASLVAWLGKPWSALALTVTSAVGMINGLWLEGLLVGILQPGKARVGRGAVALLIGRWALWALLFGFLYLIRSRIEPWSVIAGVGCFLTALAGAGMTAAKRAGREE
ncbi:MAG: hypothetical protein A2Y78_15900 [Acidobacteria bacterium RBG_13_68_16]|nr:MAG: hypothetical protein A2Y78_15900 [Acidobacteria bacterium RBG_13_68_16]